MWTCKVRFDTPCISIICIKLDCDEFTYINYVYPIRILWRIANGATYKTISFHTLDVENLSNSVCCRFRVNLFHLIVPKSLLTLTFRKINSTNHLSLLFTRGEKGLFSGLYPTRGLNIFHLTGKIHLQLSVYFLPFTRYPSYSSNDMLSVCSKLFISARSIYLRWCDQQSLLDFMTIHVRNFIMILWYFLGGISSIRSTHREINTKLSSKFQ